MPYFDRFVQFSNRRSKIEQFLGKVISGKIHKIYYFDIFPLILMIILEYLFSFFYVCIYFCRVEGVEYVLLE